jgi:hypothetical protein
MASIGLLLLLDTAPTELIGVAMSGPPLDVAAAWVRQLYVLYVHAADHGGGAGPALLQAVIDPAESAVLLVADPNPRAGVLPQARIRGRWDGPSRAWRAGDSDGPTCGAIVGAVNKNV